MRPTIDDKGKFVNRSVCGSPSIIENTLQRRDTFKQEYNDLKKMLINSQKKRNPDGSLAYDPFQESERDNKV